MIKFDLIATDEHPIRASALPALFTCPLKVVLNMFDKTESTSGKAADTGTATGRFIELWHKNGGNFQDAWDNLELDAAGQGEVDPFDNWDSRKVWLIAERYAEDKRNRPANTAVFLDSLEAEVWLRLPPDLTDPTGNEIVIRGHLDLIRKSRQGVYTLWDVKTSTYKGDKLLNKYLLQQVAYLYAARETWPELNIQPGGILAVHEYISPKANRDIPAKDINVFYKYDLSEAQYEKIIGFIPPMVARLRRGQVHCNPGDFCKWCSAEEPINCLEHIT